MKSVKIIKDDSAIEEAKMDTVGINITYECNQVFNASPKTIQFPNYKRISAS